MSDERLQKYRDRLAAGQGLLAREWDHFDSLEKQLEPQAYADRQVAGSRRVAMDYARQLPTADLEAILSDRKASDASDDLQIWLRHGRIGTGRGYEAEVERAKEIEARAVTNGER